MGDVPYGFLITLELDLWVGGAWSVWSSQLAGRVSGAVWGLAAGLVTGRAADALLGDIKSHLEITPV